MLFLVDQLDLHNGMLVRNAVGSGIENAHNPPGDFPTIKLEDREHACFGRTAFKEELAVHPLQHDAVAGPPHDIDDHYPASAIPPSLSQRLEQRDVPLDLSVFGKDRQAIAAIARAHPGVSGLQRRLAEADG